jgi:hypothetical protein
MSSRRRSLLVEVSGVIEAPPDRVRDAMAEDLIPPFEITDNLIVYQGGWWYRGEWSMTSHPKGTLVVHRVYNVAETMRWAVSLANRLFYGYSDTTRKGFAEGLAQIGKRLGCSVHLT